MMSRRDLGTPDPLARPTIVARPARWMSWQRLWVAGSLACGLACGAVNEPPASKPSLPNVLLVVIDTLRADHLPTYGYRRATAPRLDALAQSAIVFDEGLSVIGLTLPAHVSIMTGIHPWTHHVATNGRAYDGRYATLAQRLSEAGYATGAFVSGLPLARKQGLDLGFDLYRDTRSEQGELGPRVSAEQTTGRALAWLREVGDRPFFLFVHYYDVHTHYGFPADARQPFEVDAEIANVMAAAGVAGLRVPDLIPDLRLNGRPVELPAAINAYDNAIRRVDDQLGELFAAVDRLAPGRDSLLIVTSDHGEGLGEHGYYQHHKNLYDEQLHIPLIIRPPRSPCADCPDAWQPGRVSGIASQLDIAPTVLDFAGLPPTLPRHGRSLRPRMQAPEAPDSRAPNWLLACRLGFAKKTGAVHWPKFSASSPLCVARGDDAFKYLRHGDGREELYDLQDDPGELRDLSRSRPSVVSRLRGVMESLKDRFSDGVPVRPKEVDPELREQLEALGYVQ